ncbi:TPA: HNH endonuclease [Staphylococcus aureus]|nr:HNH endonuclease [Staphylococcus aureus]
MRFKWEQKHIDYVKSIYKGRYLKDVRDMFNNKFGTNISKDAINAKMNRLGVKSGVSPYGSRQAHGHLHKPIGSKKLGQHGYVLIKVDNKTNNQRNNWKLYHHYVWEKYYGEIPPKHAVIFLNGNKKDFRIENLAMITYSTLQMMINNNLFYENAELTKTGINIAKLLKKQTRRSVKKMKNKEKE